MPRVAQLMSHLRQIDVFLPDYFFDFVFCFSHGILKSLVNSAFVDQRLLILNFPSLFIPWYNVILFNFRICFINPNSQHRNLKARSGLNINAKKKILSTKNAKIPYFEVLVNFACRKNYCHMSYHIVS